MTDYTYPVLNITNGTVDLLTYPGTVTGGYFAPILLVLAFILVFIGLKRAGTLTTHAFMSSSFSITILAILMSLIPNFISPEVVVMTIFVTAVAAIVLYFEGS